MSYIPLDRTKQPADAIASLVNHAISIKEEANRVMAQVNSITNGGASAANIEVYGVPSGQGSTVYATVHDTIYLNVTAMTDSILAAVDAG